TRWVASKLAERGVATTILPVTTAGDRDRERPIESLGVNVFVKELEIALRERRADYAVHSCKDLPSQLPADMTIAAISARQDPRDGFCSERYERFADLPPGAIVGTSSPRRRAALALLRPDLDYREMRGNVDTRLRKLQEGRYDAIVLAMAGLKRLGAGATHTVAFSVEDVVPAVGQGALAIETLANDAPIARTLRDAVNDVTAELCIGCERAALRALRAGCCVPLGVHASLDGDIMTVRGFFGGADAEPRRALLRDAVRSMREADSLGSRLADALRSPLSGRLVVVPRTQARPSRVAGALRELGAEVVELRAGDAWPDPAERMPDMLLFASSGAVAAAEPYLRGLRALTRKPIVAAIGPRTSAAAAGAGFAPDAEASAPSVEALVELARKRLERA
ncbi:MAG: hydroxymethylbilane synthase, partial [Candidatus Eremiobacteraeota bacterium]|nr:hydroxymethylbilane synthase [Candidatus Eremiobacteraeota bacterium]